MGKTEREGESNTDKETEIVMNWGIEAERNILRYKDRQIEKQRDIDRGIHAYSHIDRKYYETGTDRQVDRQREIV